MGRIAIVQTKGNTPPFNEEESQKQWIKFKIGTVIKTTLSIGSQNHELQKLTEW